MKRQLLTEANARDIRSLEQAAWDAGYVVFRKEVPTRPGARGRRYYQILRRVGGGFVKVAHSLTEARAAINDDLQREDG